MINPSAVAGPMSSELEKAHQELMLAWHQFEQAPPEEPDFVDAAIYRINAAERMYGRLLVQRKNITARMKG